jgi:hypothetical protein
MTQEQKLEIVYKKLFNQRAFTKEGTQFFEEPFSTFSQVPLSYIYVNSNYIPQTAPNGAVAVAGVQTLTYVEKEIAVSVDSEGKKFNARNGRIIPTSFGTGYGIEIRTQSGSLIDIESFPYIVDWESGQITFDNTPFDVDFKNPPLLTYHCYSGKTLESITTFTQPGQRGEIGPIGETGPIDDSVMVYRGQTNFTVSPAVQYKPNDVITFTTNGNSYICLSATTSSPIASPASWENISPSGTTAEMSENVLYLNHPNAIPTSSLSNGSPFYFTSLQDAIDYAQEDAPTTIIVNQLNNQYPVVTGDVTIQNKVLNIVFRKWANLSSDAMLSSGFTLSITDSDVVIQNAQIGGNFVFKSYDGANDVIIDSISSETIVKFIDCKINSKLIKTTRGQANNSTVVFERCSINTEKIITNADIIIKDSTFSGSITADYTQDPVQGERHIFHVVNSFGFQRTTRGSLRNLQAYDVVILTNRDDVQNLSVKFENSLLPGVGIVLSPETFIYSPDVVRVDANNSMFYHFGLDLQSANQGGTINVVGSNVGYGINFNNFAAQFFTIDEPYNAVNGDFYFSIDGPGGAQTPVVTWDDGAIQVVSYDAYKSLVIDELEKLMLSL